RLVEVGAGGAVVALEVVRQRPPGNVGAGEVGPQRDGRAVAGAGLVGLAQGLVAAALEEDTAEVPGLRGHVLLQVRQRVPGPALRRQLAREQEARPGRGPRRLEAGTEALHGAVLGPVLQADLLERHRLPGVLAEVAAGEVMEATRLLALAGHRPRQE